MDLAILAQHGYYTRRKAAATVAAAAYAEAAAEMHAPSPYSGASSIGN
jgi:hypothetical protein